MAFYNCISLTDINIPDALESIKKKAFQKCISLKTFRIPANLNTLGIAALNYMDSLERIEVSPENEKFLTPDNKILIKTYGRRISSLCRRIKTKKLLFI